MNPRGRNGRFLKRSRRTNARRRRRRNPIALAANPRRRRRRNPIALAANPRRRRRRRNPIAAIAANPRRRRRHRNPRSYRRRYRRNPSMGGLRSMLSVRGLMNTLVPAGIGGAGALGVEIALAYIPLPEWFETPIGRMVARIAGAIGVGALAAFVVPRRTAGLITAGALTVTAYGTIRDFVSENFPQIPRSAGLCGILPPMGGDYSDTRMGYLSPAPRLSAYMNRRDSAPLSGVGAYMRRPIDTVNNLSGVTSDGM